MFKILLIVLLFLPGSGNAENIDWDFTLNKTFFIPNSGGGFECLDDSVEIDSWWLDSWTADGEECFWYSPEDYEFQKGDLINCLVYFYRTYPAWSFERWDGFYFCGEQGAQNYIAYSWADLGEYLTGAYCVSVIQYDTSTIPDRFLPLSLDWASKCVGPSGWFAGGIPLTGRPDCFTITK